MISKIFSLRNYVMKQIMKPNKQGIMQIPDKGKVDFGEMIIKEQLFKKGIDPKAITSEKQLDNILNTPTVSPHSPPKNPGEVINVDFDKGRWKDIDPENLAHGGRTGTGLNYLLGEDDQNVRVPFKDGTKFDPKRRTVLKGIAALATLPVIGKFFKWAKPAAKIADVTSVPIKNISGMPAWFKPLVNKVIKEGDDVTKKLATQERQIVHTKKLDEFDEVTVTQDLNTGNVRVEYHGSTNMGEAPIQLDYKAGEIIEPTKTSKGIKTKPEFSAVESEPRVTNWDGDIEWDGENVVNKVDDLLTDTTKLETYATGKKPNIKKLLKSEQKKKYVNKLNDDQMEQINFIENKHGPGPDPTDFFDEKDLGKDFASGGRVPFFKGKLAKGILSLGKKKKKKLTADDVSQDHPLRRKEFEEELFGTKEQQESKKFKEKLIKKLEQYHKLKYMDTKGKKGHAFGGRVPLRGGGADLIDTEWDDMDSDEWLHLIKLLRAGEIGAAQGGRVPLGKGKIVKGLAWLSQQDFQEPRSLDRHQNPWLKKHS
jgi:hypothetical protein